MTPTVVRRKRVELYWRSTARKVILEVSTMFFLSEEYP
jgi:hypothetical protein